MRGTIVVVFFSTLAVVCCTTPKRPLAPRDSSVDRSAANFSGTYCFASMQESFREYNGIGYLTPRPFSDMSPVTISHSPAKITMTYTSTDGVRDEMSWAASEGEWRDGKLVVPVPNGGNPFGAYYSRSWMTFYRLQDGRLIVQRNDADTGLTCLFIPSHDKRESMIVLDREARCGRTR